MLFFPFFIFIWGRVNILYTLFRLFSGISVGPFIYTEVLFSLTSFYRYCCFYCHSDVTGSDSNDCTSNLLLILLF